MPNEATTRRADVKQVKRMSIADKISDASDAVANGETKFQDVSIRTGKQDSIVLPQGMTNEEAIVWLQKNLEEQEKEIAIHAEIHCFPLDGAIALSRALNEIFGFVSLERTPSFFGSKPPTMVTVPISLTEFVQVPWGRMSIPGVEGYIETSASCEKPIFYIAGAVKQKDKAKVERIITATKQNIAQRSIYKGQALRLDMSYIRDGREFSLTDDAPQFIDVSSVKAEELIFPKHVERLLNVVLFTPIEHSAACRTKKIPLKRGVLLSGNYGTGKTLTAYVTARKAVDNGWTMVYLKNVEDLAAAIELARLYAPSVVFAEDVDRVVELDRTDAVDEILNTIDGIDAKSSEIIVVLTTNHIDKINEAMLRPGRLDAVVPVPEPDAEAAERLVRLYGRDSIPENVSLTEVGKMLSGKIPAVIREVVERSKMFTIADGDSEMVTAEALMLSAEAMKQQIGLINRDKGELRHEAVNALGMAIGESLARALGRTGKEAQVQIERTFGDPARAGKNGDGE